MQSWRALYSPLRSFQRRAHFRGGAEERKVGSPRLGPGHRQAIETVPSSSSLLCEAVQMEWPFMCPLLNRNSDSATSRSNVDPSGHGLGGKLNKTSSDQQFRSVTEWVARGHRVSGRSWNPNILELEGTTEPAISK